MKDNSKETLPSIVPTTISEERIKAIAYTAARFGLGGPFDYIPSNQVVEYGVEVANRVLVEANERSSVTLTEGETEERSK